MAAPERPPSLTGIALLGLVMLVIVWWFARSILALVFGFFKVVLLVGLAVAAISWVVRHSSRR